MKTTGVVTAAVAGLVGLVLMFVMLAVADDQASTSPGVVCAPSTGGKKVTSVAGYRGVQLTNAKAIVTAAEQLHLPDRAAVIGVATAMGESGLRVLNHGDTAGPDSRGLFQQRTGWGSLAARMDPVTSAKLFFLAMIHDVPNWATLPLTVVAHRVQRNAYPDAYAQFEHAAEQVVGAVKGIACTDQPGTKKTKVATETALAQVGKPYQWGAAGPDAFDCSGLTMFSWAKAGVQLPRTSAGQYRGGGARVARTQLRPGDVLFFSSNGSPSGIHHVGMYLGGGDMVHAPHTGATVSVVRNVFADPYYASQYIGAVRPGSSGNQQN
ncbi:MAG: C40 family peptidase [Pseudonocardia sp.]|nr:C40 family peptidase [Pseudonocardia sp.]